MGDNLRGESLSIRNGYFELMEPLVFLLISGSTPYRLPFFASIIDQPFD